MRKKRSTKEGSDSNGGEEVQGSPSKRQEEMGIPTLPQQVDEGLVRFGDMVKAMQYLTDEVTNLRYKLLQYELCQKQNRKR